MIHIRAAVCVGLLVMLTGCAGVEQQQAPEVYSGPRLVPAEDPIPGIPSDVEFADYWIRKTPDPDRVIMTSEQVNEFNRVGPWHGIYVIDVPTMGSQTKGEKIREYIASNARYLLTGKFYVTGDIPLEQAERQRIVALMDTSGVPDLIDIKFGIVLQRTLGKLWPSNIPVMDSPGENEFDQGMAATVDFGEPVALLHVSRDGLWSYVQTENFGCWIPSEAAAYGDIKTVRELTDTTSPIVAIGNRVAVYGNPSGGPAIGYLNMGGHLPIRSAGSAFCEVLIPGRGQSNELVSKSGYVRRSSDISIGFLPYTPRNVFQQCFLLYGARYGWGGMYDNRDCSGYIRDIFRCFNIRLPRNSASQGQASRRVVPMEGLDRAARIDALRNTPGGISLLQMPGHIMIYLGEAGGKPYAIHDFWSWREGKGNNIDVTHRVARVAVTDLVLGEGSTKGAFLDRLANIAVITPPVKK